MYNKEGRRRGGEWGRRERGGEGWVRIEGEKEERERKEEEVHAHMYLPTNGLRDSEESRKVQSRPMRCSLPLSCSTIANTSDVSSSQAMCGYLGKKRKNSQLEDPTRTGSVIRSSCALALEITCSLDTPTVFVVWKWDMGTREYTHSFVPRPHFSQANRN